MNRGAIAILCGAIVGAALFRRYPFPDHEPLLRMVHGQAAWLFYTLRYSWQLMMFTTPALLFSVLGSFAFVFTRPRERIAGALPPVPKRTDLGVVLGEVHHPRRVQRAEHPNWLVIPERGLYTGICIVGAIGSGKTTGAMRPYAKQVLEFAAGDPARRPAGIVLEVKGDFCAQVREILKEAGRAEDYIEIGLDSPFVYNPLNSDQDAFSLAYSIATLLTNLYGRGKEPFWQQAYTNLVKFVILLHKVVDGYCTLFQVYECAINPDRMKRKIEEGEAMFARYASAVAQIVIQPLVYFAHDELAGLKWESRPNDMRTAYSEDLVERLEQWGAVYKVEEPEPLPAKFSELVGQFEAAKRWFTHDWSRIDPKLRTSIVEGIAVFLSLFDDNPQVKRIFCPPRQAFDSVANAGRKVWDSAAAVRGTNRIREGSGPEYADCSECGHRAGDWVHVEAGFPTRNAAANSEDGCQSRRGVPAGALPRRRVPVVRHGGGVRPVRRREVLRAVPPGEVHPDRGDAEHQFLEEHLAGRVLADAAADLPDEGVPVPERRLQRQGGERPVRKGRTDDP